MKKAYPALFHLEDGGYWAEFPDLPGCFTQADTVDAVVANAADALGIHLCSILEDGDPLPEPSDIRALSVEDGFTSVVIADPLAYKANTRSVKKTLSIPAWLNDEAEKRNINFSQVLQKALLAIVDI